VNLSGENPDSRLRRAGTYPHQRAVSNRCKTTRDLHPHLETRASQRLSARNSAPAQCKLLPSTLVHRRPRIGFFPKCHASTPGKRRNVSARSPADRATGADCKSHNPSFPQRPKYLAQTAHFLDGPPMATTPLSMLPSKRILVLAEHRAASQIRSGADRIGRLL
jgi:hypothetical protein